MDAMSGSTIILGPFSYSTAAPLESFKIECALTWEDGSGPGTVVDDGGDATLFIHGGFRSDKAFEKDGLNNLLFVKFRKMK